MKRLLTLLLVLLTFTTQAAERPKYIFYFIGDGMGHNAVTLTEGWLASEAGDPNGFVPLNFTLFPAVGIATSHCATRRVTDSAAAGTALATGTKTAVGAIGVDIDNRPLQSVAVDAKNLGLRSGVITSVSIDHATPASFFAHQPERGMYYEISLDLPITGLDLYGGAGFLNPEPADKPSLWPVLDQAGYTITRGDRPITGERAIIMREQGEATDALALAIDATESDLTLPAMTRRAIDYLARDDKGFFLMVEGGQIDWTAHSNDAAALVHETLDFANAINVALEFYRRYPEQTLILVTADHETGGVALGSDSRGYDTFYNMLSLQKCSGTELTRRIRVAGGWQQARLLLEENLSFGQWIEVGDEQWNELEKAYERGASRLTSRALKLMADYIGAGWTTGSHTAAYVPVFAIGAGSDLFNGRMDNTDMPIRLRKLMSGK